jgi:hypothetical protein
MKRTFNVLALVVCFATLVGGVAYATNQFLYLVQASGGIKVGATGTDISDSYAASSAIDFAGVTDQCEDSSGITVTGAAVNDVCTVGPPATMPCAHCWLTCYVSAANTVKVRLCAHGASGNPASATYAVRVVDP